MDDAENRLTTVQSKGSTDIIGAPTLVHSNGSLTLQTAGSITVEANATMKLDGSGQLEA